MKAKPASRAYESPLRAAQAAQTRSRIIDAAVDLLQDGDAGEIGMQDVADRAGVSVRTVYRSFPTRDDLFVGVLGAIKERFEASAGARPTTAHDLVASAPSAVQAVFELEPLYRALFATAKGRELHRRTAAERELSIEEAFPRQLDGLTATEVHRFAAVMHLATSSTAVLFLKDYGGLDGRDAAPAVGWMIRALIAAIDDPELRRHLGGTGDSE